MSAHKDLTGADLHGSKSNTGAGSPVGSVTPSVIGEHYFDSTGKNEWVAFGLTDADWQAIGGGALGVLTTREIYFTRGKFDKVLGAHAYEDAKAGKSTTLGFNIPDDFVSLVELTVGLVSNATIAAADLDLTSDYNAKDESITENSEADLTGTYAVTDSVLREASIASVFTALAAGDDCGLTLLNNEAATIYASYIRLKYSLL